MMRSRKPRETGLLAEKLAAEYLKKQTLRLHQTNYWCRVGEIDLIMWDNEYLVFVEVRHRKHRHYGGALESIDNNKKNKLRRAAQHYLVYSNNTDCPCRFDILCVNGNLHKPEFEWIKNAF